MIRSRWKITVEGRTDWDSLIPSSRSCAGNDTASTCKAKGEPNLTVCSRSCWKSQRKAFCVQQSKLRGVGRIEVARTWNTFGYCCALIDLFVKNSDDG